MDRLRCFIVFVCAVWDGEYFDELIDFYFFFEVEHGGHGIFFEFGVCAKGFDFFDGDGGTLVWMMCYL